ncbi:hypothetical protein AX16_010237 [Volvariella volvacea WC 439]|nr:hypothetical protein AX16_010237 [Volvariella volvacea WC 439]
MGLCTSHLHSIPELHEFHLELVDPAVNGTTGILTSAYRYGDRVQRIVVTGSCASVLTERGYPQTFNERDWNDQVIEDIGRNGDETPALTKYRASKVLAEKAAWKWYWGHRDKLKFDMVVLNPPLVFGPTIQPITSPFLLGESASALFNTLLIPGFRSREELLFKGNSWIDVRDLAIIHVRALKRPEAGEQRIIVASGPFVWQEWVDIANSIEPCPVPFHAPFPKGFPLRGAKPEYWYVYNTDKAAKLLHVGSGRPLNEDEERDWYPLRTMEETCRDFLDEYDIWNTYKDLIRTYASSHSGIAF